MFPRSKLDVMTGLARQILERQPTQGLTILNTLAQEIFPGYKLRWPEVEWMNNGKFNNFLRLFKEEFGFNAERRWMVYQLARLTKQVPGDTAECGVFQGAGCTSSAWRAAWTG